MIKINGQNNYHFPTIDFMFQNTGTTTAILRQFTIDVSDVEIDVTPVLRFTSRVDGGRLVVLGKNNGWGAAKNCAISIEEPILSTFFTEDQRSYQGIIDSGQDKTLICLDTSRVDISTFSSYLKTAPNLAKGNRDILDDMFDRRFSGREGNKIDSNSVQLGSVSAIWRCEDEIAKEYNGSSSIGHNKPYLFLSPTGFSDYSPPPPCASMMGSDATYCTIIEPSRGAHERAYPISRQIAPGEAERFHILIGATKSCNLRVRFRFSVDKTKEVLSDTFNIKIWHPRDSWLHRDYQDGQVLERRKVELEGKRQLDYYDKWELERFASRNPKSYDPFINPDASERDRWRY